MRIINDYQDYIDTIARISKKKELLISTYGLSIDDKLTALFKASSSLKVIVGLYDRYCIPGCHHCKNNIATNKNSIFRAQVKFGKENIIAVNYFHKKIAISNGTVIIGGFNLTSSSFIDNAIEIKNKQLFKDSIQLFNLYYKELPRVKLNVPMNDLVTFGKYKGNQYKTMQGDKDYLRYLHDVMDKSKFEELTRLKY